MVKTPEGFYTTKETAELTGKSLCYISDSCKKGKIPGVLYKKHTYFVPCEWVRHEKDRISFLKAAERLKITRFKLYSLVAQRVIKNNPLGGVSLRSLKKYERENPREE